MVRQVNYAGTFIRHEYGSGGPAPLDAYIISGNSPSLVADVGADIYGLDAVVKTAADVITFTRASAGAYVNGSWVLADAAIDERRVDYAPNGGAIRGLLMESQQQNIIPDSEDFTQWVASNGTLSTTTMTFIGAKTAYEFVAVGGNARVYRNITMTGGTYSIRCHFKAGGTLGGTIIYIITSGFTNAESVYLDVSDGSLTVSGAGLITWTANNLGNGEWELLGQGGGTGVDETGNISFYARSAAGGNSVAGDGFKLFGAEAVLSATIGSYVSASGAATTRAADVASKPLSAFNFSATAGSMLIEFESTAIAGQVLWSLHDGTANERVYLSRDASNQITLNVVDGGVSQAAIVGAASAGVGPFKVAVAWAAGDFAISVNGAAVVTDAAGTLPTLTALQYMADYTGANSGQGALKQQVYYPVRLTNADLVTWSGA